MIILLYVWVAVEGDLQEHNCSAQKELNNADTDKEAERMRGYW